MLEIVKTAQNLGLVEIDLDLLLVGRETRPLPDALAFTSQPFIEGLTWNRSACLSILNSAGIKVKALERICELKKTDNTETGYKEFFTTNDFIKRKFLLPEKNIKIPKKFRFSLDYPEDLELAKIIFSKLGTNFDTTKLLKFIEENPNLQKIIDPIIEKWKKDYDQNITKFDLNKLD